MTTRRPPRPPRWDRRESDGAAWLDAAALAVQQDHAAPQIARKRRRFSATFSPLLNREPFPGVTADLRRRLAAAGRTATVNFAIFAALVFSGQKSLPAAWVGNVLAVTALKDTLGETFLFARSIVLSMVPVSVSCCAVGYILGRFDDLWYSILLPGVVLVGSLIVVLCPQLPNKNLMLVILYLTVASPLSSKETVYLDAPSKDLGAWFSVRLAGTCVVGLSIAVMLHLSLKFTPNSTTAHRMTDRLIWRLRFETEQLLRAVLQYTQNIGVATLTARKSRTMIEFYICSRGKTISKIEQLADAVKAERVFGEASIDCTKLKKFIECAKKQQRHTEMIRQATAEEFLGEEYTSHNENVKSIKTKISTNLGFALDCLVAEFCRCERDFLDFRHTSAHQDCSSGLAQCMDLYRQKMKAAIEEAEQMLDENEEAKRQTAGPLVRSRVVFLGVSSFVREFQDLTAATSSDKMEAKVPGRSTNLTALMSQLKSQMTLSWPWKNVAKRRLAVKTSVGLCVASLWVSIPYYPSGIWPGITVASISLSTSGASYVKSLDRLWGTLVAAAFSLLLTSAVESEIATLLLMTVFAFASIMVSNPDREYASRYAATSVGSILYGSVENNMDVRQYAPLRVMLIFVGVAIFLFVELVIFPRSSRTVVQAKSLEFFEHLEVCLTDCSNLLSTIGSQPEVTAEDSDAFRDQITANPLWMLKEGQDSVDLAGSLSESVKAVKETFSAFKIELGPGLVEPGMLNPPRLDGVRVCFDDDFSDKFVLSCVLFSAWSQRTP